MVAIIFNWTDTALTLLDVACTPPDMPLTLKETVLTLTDTAFTVVDTPLTWTDMALTVADTAFTPADAPLTLNDTVLTLTDTAFTVVDTPLTLTDTALTVADTAITPADAPLTRNDNNPNTTDDDHKADMLYLRRGDGLQATGFIQNRTYNFYTEARLFGLEGTSCYDFDAFQEWESADDPGVANYGTRVNVPAELSGVNALFLNGLNSNSSYQTAFYDGYYPVDIPSVPFIGPISTSTNTNGAFAMPHPDLGIPDYPLSSATPCFLFRTEQIGSPFKLEENEAEMVRADYGRQEINSFLIGDPTDGYQVGNGTVLRGIGHSLSVYPNPVTGSLLHVDMAEGDLNSVPIRYQVFDISGKLIRDGIFERLQNTLNMAELALGTYNLRLSLVSGTSNHLIIIAQ
jgi:hypothetical protein